SRGAPVYRAYPVYPARAGTHGLVRSLKSVNTSTSPLGRPVRRREDAALLTGRGRYVEDFDVPGTANVAFVRSPYAKARILAIDTRAAKASPSVLLVVTADDLSGVADMPLNQR